MHDVQETQDSVSKFSSTQPSLVEKQLFGSGKTESFKSTNFGFSQRVTSPEIISQGPYSYGSAKLSVDDLDLNSPSSVQSPFFQEQEAKAGEIQDKFLQEEEDDDEDDDEVMRSYVIEINSDHKEDTAESQDLEEAIAWAKEKFQSHSSPEDQSVKQKERGLNVEQNEKEVSDGSPVALHNLDGQIDGCGSLHLQEKKMALLEEDIRLWSSGKDKNIQLLLATLDYILCPSSGWYPVQLTNLNTSANVKKAYQKARLCLHPDKMQQRGANFAQKYVAEKAFPILLDAWAAFISQDVMPSTRR